MSRKEIHVNDFNLFADVIKSATKIVESAKITVNENGVEIYGCRGKLTRCELSSDAITCDESVELTIESLGTFYKVLCTVCEIHKDDFLDFKFAVDMPKVLFESKKFKTKFQTQVETVDAVAKWISTKITTQLVPEFEFTTTSDLIRRIGSHSFIFDKIDDLRVYLETKDDMEKNALFATLGNKTASLSNEMTLKFGIVTNGAIAKDRNLILDLEHLNLFNALPSNDIKIFLPKQYNMLVSKAKVNGKNGTYFNMNIYNALLKS